MLNSRMGVFRRIFGTELRDTIKRLEAENSQLQTRVRYEQARADLADKSDEVAELRQHIKQLRAVLDTCAHVLSSAAKS